MAHVRRKRIGGWSLARRAHWRCRPDRDQQQAIAYPDGSWLHEDTHATSVAI